MRRPSTKAAKNRLEKAVREAAKLLSPKVAAELRSATTNYVALAEDTITSQHTVLSDFMRED